MALAYRRDNISQRKNDLSRINMKYVLKFKKKENMILIQTHWVLENRRILLRLMDC